MENLSYELAHELKICGFPQGIGRYVGKDWKGGGDEESLLKNGFIGAYDPTLEELIEACGDSFSMLLNDTFHIWNEKKRTHENFKGWFAGQEGTGEDGSNIYDEYAPQGFGYTPKEAVARLWLAINKK